MPERQAYDVSRREFYRLRQQEEVEKRVVLEEARYVGAYFGKNRLEIGMHLEDREFEKWKVWAAKEVADREARAKAGVETFDIEDDADGEEALALDDVAGGSEDVVKRSSSRF
jgi:small subunit ribosomal protein S23